MIFFGRIINSPFDLHEKMSTEQAKTKDSEAVNGKFNKWDVSNSISFIVDKNKEVVLENPNQANKKFFITNKIRKNVPLEIQAHKQAYAELFTG